MKPATAKAKGAATETALCVWLNDHDVRCERRHLAGVHDKGDIAVHGRDVVIEVKSGARLDVAGWLAELDAEIHNAGASEGFLAVRPRGRPHPDGWWAVMRLPDMVRVLRAAGVL